MLAIGIVLQKRKLKTTKEKRIRRFKKVREQNNASVVDVPLIFVYISI